VTAPFFDVIRVTADLRAECAGRRRQRLRNSAGTADREDRLPCGSAIIRGRVAEKDRGGPRGPRPDGAVLNAAPGNRGLDRVGFERLGHEVRDCHGQDAQDRVGIALAEASERPPELQPGERVAETGRMDVRGRLACDLAEKATERADEAIEVRVAFGVVRRPFAKPVDRSCLVGPERDRPAVRLRGEDSNIRGNDPEPVAAKVQVAHDRRPQPADRVGEARNAGTSQHRRLCGAADPRPTFEDDRPPARLREISRRDKPVVPATDDDRVVRSGPRRRHAALRPRARSTSIAAMRPFAPMIPPPGWVAEPHNQRSRIGVRKRA
jgi:hypothetical protein